MKPLVLLAPLLALACAPLNGEPGASFRPSATSPSDDTGDLSELTATLDVQAGAEANLFYSPASVAQAFGLLRVGAAGDTGDEIDRVLSPPSRLGELRHKSDGVELRVANALWLSDAWRFEPRFVEQADERFDATADRLDFGQAVSAAARINRWADEATESLIPTIVQPDDIDPDTVAFLTNALYFDGLWRTPFDSEQEAPFLFGDGIGRPFTLMRQTMELASADADGWKAVRLPYQGGRYAMDVMIPEKRVVRPTLPDAATIAALARGLGQSKPRPIDLRLPQFEVNYDVPLIAPLRAIGLTLPFDRDRADFSNLVAPDQRRVFVDEATHIARLQVFDIGTRAAAVTTMRIIPVGRRAYRTEPIDFIVDRPFGVVIRDLETGTVLFIGRIADPQPFAPEVAEPDYAP